MVSDSTYELCLPVLQDSALEEEDKTEKLEELLGKETSLTGPSLENAVLDVLWRFRESVDSKPSTPPVRHTVVPRPSPASWQFPRASTPLGSSPGTGVSPAPPPGFGIAPPAFTRARSSQASPFTSPRPSPRLAFSNLHIPHSPSLNAYEFTDSSPAPDIYGDYGSDNVDWLVNDDAASTTSSTGGVSSPDGTLGAGTLAYMQPQQSDMSPYDMLRSVLGDGKTDEEIEKALEMNGYDLSATIATLMEGSTSSHLPGTTTGQDGTVLVGKAMNTAVRSITPSNQNRSGVVCRFWLSTGQCLRADCRFSHDLSNHICKYWMMGNCLAGDTCIFSHDPSGFMNRLTLDDNGNSNSAQNEHADFQLQDYNAFPSLQANSTENWVADYQQAASAGFWNPYNQGGLVAPPPGFDAYSGPANLSRQSGSRASSRQHSRPSTPSIPAVDDNEAFPSLGSATMKIGKKHHGKRGGHGHGHKEIKEIKEFVPSSLADVVRNSPSPSPGQNRKNVKPTKAGFNSRENSTAARAIPPPHHVPWLETGENTNKAYLKARQEAIKHGSLRNKFLQSAAQAWNRNDARAAKALSLRGQSENELMRKAHREAARQLYEERNKNASADGELYVDLHGLHPDEAVEYLERVLLEQQSSTKPVYAITGTGHHSKNGKDKVGKAIRAFLNEWRYAYREFSVPGDRNNVGGILGIVPQSYDRNASAISGNEVASVGEGGREGSTESAFALKIKVAKEPPKGPGKKS